MYGTERLLLRGIDEETDLDTFVRWQNDATWMGVMWSGPIGPMSRERTKDFIKPRPAGGLPRFAVCEKPDTQDHKFQYTRPLPPMIGVLNFQDHSFDWKNRVVYLGLGFADPQHQGKGYGTELLRWALEYSFCELGIHKVALEAYSFNQNAANMYQKVGFTQEGRLRKTVLRGGEWHDTLIFGFLEEDWLESRRKLRNQG